MRARRVFLWAAVAILAQASCAEIPTAPRQMVTLHGTILTRDGEPVSALTLAFYESGRESYSHTYHATTGSDGSYRAEVAAGRYFVLLVPEAASGLPRSTITEITVSRADPRFDYTYGGLRVEGHLLDPHGAPVLNVELGFISEYEPGRERIGAFATSYDGTYRVYVPAGRYSVEALPASSVSGVPGRIFRGVSVSSDTTIDLALTGYRISGRVTRPEGTPMGDATIYYSTPDASAGANTLADGSYELYVPGGIYTIYAYPGLSDRDVEGRSLGKVAVSGDMVRDLPMTGIWWQGTVRSPEDGSLVSGAEVRVRLLDDLGSSLLARVVTGIDGAFRISVASPAWHSISVYAAGRETMRWSQVPAGADSTFDLTAGALIAP